MTPKKPPSRAVKAISGAFQEDWIEQKTLERLTELQQTEFLAASETRECAFEVEARIRQGAQIRPGALVFDRKLKMARRREDEKAAG